MIRPHRNTLIINIVHIAERPDLSGVLKSSHIGVAGLAGHVFFGLQILTVSAHLSLIHI